MKFYICFIAIPDSEAERMKEDLVSFKNRIKKVGEMTVVETIQDNYDFLYNSSLEKARAEEKGR